MKPICSYFYAMLLGDLDGAKGKLVAGAQYDIRQMSAASAAEDAAHRISPGGDVE